MRAFEYVKICFCQGSHFASLGYELVSTTTYNAVFVQNRLYPLFNIGDNSIDVMHDVPIPMEIFQLYDGTLKLTGCKKLIWKKVPIEEERLQVIAPEERFFALAPFEKGRLSDDMTQDKKYFEQCQASSTHDWMHFVKRGHAAISVHSNKVNPTSYDVDCFLILFWCTWNRMFRNYFGSL